MDCSMPGLPVHHQLLEFTHTHVHWVSNAIQPFHPLLSPCLPAFNLSQHQGLFQWVSSSHQMAKGLKLQLQHQSLNSVLRPEYSGLISFLGCTSWISVQSKGLSRVFSSTTIWKFLQHSVFFMVQLSHPYMTTGKTIALTRWTFVGKRMSLLFNTLSMLIIAFLPRSKVS